MRAVAVRAPESVMFRYRCPNCSQLLQALEIRAGKLTVCSQCSQPLTIPADRALWLNEKGDALVASPTLVMPSVSDTPPSLLHAPIRLAEPSAANGPDSDVL